MKPRSVVEDYAALHHPEPPTTIVELGIHRGGSTALLHQLFHPTVLTAFELSDVPVEALAAYFDGAGAEGSVGLHYGVDQADRERVARHVDEDLEGRPLDLVIDDASHLYDPTLASFEVLFPRLRPGGRYIIEDWCWEDRLRADMRRARAAGGAAADALDRKIAQAVASRGGDAGPPQTRPLSRLALQLVLSRAADDRVASVELGRSWVVVVRGPGAIDPDGFRLDELGFDSFRQLVPLEG